MKAAIPRWRALERASIPWQPPRRATQRRAYGTALRYGTSRYGVKYRGGAPRPYCSSRRSTLGGPRLRGASATDATPQSMLQKCAFSDRVYARSNLQRQRATRRLSAAPWRRWATDPLPVGTADLGAHANLVSAARFAFLADGRAEARTYCKIMIIWRLSALDMVARNIWIPRRNFAVWTTTMNRTRGKCR